MSIEDKLRRAYEAYWDAVHALNFDALAAASSARLHADVLHGISATGADPGEALAQMKELLVDGHPRPADLGKAEFLQSGETAGIFRVTEEGDGLVCRLFRFVNENGSWCLDGSIRLHRDAGGEDTLRYSDVEADVPLPLRIDGTIATDAILMPPTRTIPHTFIDLAVSGYRCEVTLNGEAYATTNESRSTSIPAGLRESGNNIVIRAARVDPTVAGVVMVTVRTNRGGNEETRFEWKTTADGDHKHEALFD